MVTADTDLTFTCIANVTYPVRITCEQIGLAFIVSVYQLDAIVPDHTAECKSMTEVQSVLAAWSVT